MSLTLVDSYGMLNDNDFLSGLEFLREDLMASGGAAVQLSLVNDIFPHYETDKQREKYNLVGKTKEPEFEEAVIPSRMKRWTSDISSHIAFLIHGQEMANISSKEFATASKKDPPYIPFVVPKVHEKPWGAPLQAHERADK